MTMLFGFFTPGPWEIAIIAMVSVLLFGSQLPKIMGNVGRAIPSLKKGMAEVQAEITEIESTINDAE